MKNIRQNTVRFTLGAVFFTLPACQTVETGSKVVDSSKKEVIISSNSDPRSALPQGERDSSINRSREQLEESLTPNSRDVKALLSLAELQLTQNRLNDAETSCRRALLVDVKNSDAQRIMAQISIRQQNYKMALIFLTALGGEDSKDSNVHNMLGLIAYNEKKSSEAVRLWKQAINLNPSDMSARMNLGVIYLKNKMFQQAGAQFERVLKVAPAHQDAKLHLAIVDASRGNYDQAIATYKSILDQDNTNELALFNLSVAEKNSGQYDDALAGLKRLIKISKSRSATTDAAFALIDEIQTLNNKGDKISDDELQALASELAKRPASKVTSKQTSMKTSSAAKPSTEKGSTPPGAESTGKQVAAKKPAAAAELDAGTKNDSSASDRDIEALERQLKEPSH
jgi:tetratricopeptide (TPR) repeat protein